MTLEEARTTIRTAEMHIAGTIGTRIIPYTRPGGFAVVAPVAGKDGLWYLLTEYHPNILRTWRALLLLPRSLPTGSANAGKM